MHSFSKVAVAFAMAIYSATPAAEYPSRPLRIIVPFASGSGADIAVRNLANELSSQVDQQVVADNRPGASGIIGYEMIARAAPDGYTFGYITSSFATNPSLHVKLPYDSTRDFQPVILFTSSMNILTVSPSLSIRSVKELIDHARSKPGTLLFGSNGAGSPAHLSMEVLKAMTATNMVHVSYKGIPHAITDVISGQIQIVCDSISVLDPYVRSGRVRALGVTSLKRSPVMPEVPTLDEAGIPGFELTTWGGYAFPAGTPRTLVLRLNGELNRVLLLPRMLKAIADRGGTAIGGTPEQFAEHLRRETAKWTGVIKAAGIKPQ
jgi:tripartite-type tricarboxylate transporter receptor subunit TctC